MASPRSFGLTIKMTALTVVLLALAVGAVSAISLYQVTMAMKDDVVQRQERNVRTAASVFSDAIAGMRVDRDATGHVTRITMPAIPAFDDHALIDRVGALTGETATIFEWIDAEQEFIRRTTNIIKPDGNRAVGTFLGKTGAVHAVLVRGETFAGEAVILGKPYYTVYEPIFDPAGKVIGILYAGVERDRVHVLLDRMTISLGVTALIVFFVIAGAALWLYRRMLRDVPALAETMRRLAAGETGLAVPGLGRRDELGAMADAVRIFETNAEEKIRLEAERAELARTAEADRKKILSGLASDFEKRVGAIIERVSTMTETMRGSAGTLRGLAERTAERSDEASHASDGSARNIQSVAGATEELVASIREINSQITGAAGQADDAVQIVRSTNQTVEGLKQSTDRIGAVLTLIRDIAEQTNLLALNATIEAARAGEAGKGFAVVANEVKSLANQTQKATEEIAQQIQDMQAVAGSAVSAISRISARIDRINESVGSISSAAEQQSASTQEISRSVSDAGSSSHEVAGSVKEVRVAAEETGRHAGALLDTSSQLAEEARTMRTEVHRFLESVRSA